MASETIPHSDLTFRIIGCAMKVHNELGPGLREIHYHRALSRALEDAGLSFEDERSVSIEFEGRKVGRICIDHLVEGNVLVEEKALSHLLTADEIGQVITYLAATELPVGLLLNFGRQRLQYRRILPPRRRSGWQERLGRYARSA